MIKFSVCLVVVVFRSLYLFVARLQVFLQFCFPYELPSMIISTFLHSFHANVQITEKNWEELLIDVGAALIYWLLTTKQKVTGYLSMAIWFGTRVDLVLTFIGKRSRIGCGSKS